MKQSIIDGMIDIRKKLADYFLFKEKKKPAEYFLKIIYKTWGKHTKVNKYAYDLIAAAFNKVYFWKNLLKSMIFFDKYFDLIGNGILDVGCGAAPTSIAIAYLAKNKKRENISISLLDKSKSQLSIAKDFAQILSIKIKSDTEAFFDLKEEKYKELVVFSYFFCEQKQGFLKALFHNREKFSNGFVVIDYKENIMHIKKYFKDNGDNRIKAVCLKDAVPEILSEFIQDKEVSVYACFYKP